MKKKWYKTPQGITAICVMILAISGIIYKGAKIVLIPERVEANEQEIYNIKEWVNEQRITNELMRQQQQYQQPQYQYQQPQYNQPNYPPPKNCQYDPDEVLWCWDREQKEWYRWST